MSLVPHPVRPIVTDGNTFGGNCCIPIRNTPKDGMLVNSNRFRNQSLIYMFSGFFIIYCGIYSRALLPYLLAVGSVGVFIGIMLYFRYGPVNQTNVHTLECPRCGQMARLTGQEDMCSHCGQAMRRTEAGTYEPFVKA